MTAAKFSLEVVDSSSQVENTETVFGRYRGVEARDEIDMLVHARKRSKI